MARKTIEIKLEDRGKILEFEIEQMPATRLESWLLRAGLLVAGAMGTAPGKVDIQTAGRLVAERGLGVLSGLDYEKVEPLLNELLACCYRKAGQHKERCTPESIDGYVEDVTTLFKLRTEAAKVNLGFLVAEDGPLSGFRITGDTPLK